MARSRSNQAPQRDRVVAGGSAGARTFTVRVPLAIRHRGGRKVIVMPEGAEAPTQTSPQAARPASTLVKALARAFRWRALLEDGAYAYIAEIAAAETINESYIARVIRLTLLGPNIVETILNGEQAEVTLDVLLKPFPMEWRSQTFGHAGRHGY